MEVDSAFVNTVLLRVVAAVELVSFFFEAALLSGVELLCRFIHLLIFYILHLLPLALPPVLLRPVELLDV
jgi:hypothetical protein